MFRILITGASGFVGRKVVEEILKTYPNNDVVALASNELTISTILHNNYNIDENYLLNNGCENVEVILHIGAYTPKSGEESNYIFENNRNIYTTETLLRQNLPNLKKIVFISTLDVYAPCEIINEQSLVEPVSIYGWSKLYCEKMIESYAKEKNIKYNILRLGHVYGEGEEHYNKILPLTIKKILNNEPIEIYGDGNAIRTFIYIEDVAKAIVKSIDIDYNTINVVGSEPITIRNLVKKIINISKKEIKIVYTHPEMQNRNLIFDNTLLKKYLLKEITDLNYGLEKEYHYMEKVH